MEEQHLLAAIGEIVREAVSGLRQELQQEISGLRQEFREVISDLRQELQQEIHKELTLFRNEVNWRFNVVEQAIHEVDENVRELQRRFESTEMDVRLLKKLAAQ